MVDVPCLDLLWDSQKDFPHVGQVSCFQQETKKNAPLHASGALMVVLPCLDQP